MHYKIIRLVIFERVMEFIDFIPEALAAEESEKNIKRIILIKIDL